MALMNVLRLGCADFVNCFVIVCNMSQKVFRDCLD